MIADENSHPGIIVGQQDQNLRRFLRDLRHTMNRRDPAELSDQLTWIDQTG